MNEMSPARPVPLVVDVDGTLIRTDLLHEAALQFIARHPLEIWRLAGWTLAGKARLKAELADRIDCHAATIPLCEPVVEVIRAAQDADRPVYLASASERRYVDALAERVGGIAGVFATEGDANLSGAHKAARLNEAFGERGYDYVGNSVIDFPVWRSSRRPMVVSASRGFASRVRRNFPEAEFVAHVPIGIRPYVRALRVYQWAKNLLVFLPLIAGHSFTPEAIGRAMLAFLCFSLAASSAYVINDLLDIPGDRHHPRKRARAFASGTVPVAHGPPIALLLMAAALGGALFLPLAFVGVLTLYIVLTLGYSHMLKRRVLVDVITLGGLYTIRVLAGVVALDAHESPWLLMFSLFLFLSLAIVKRCSELVARRGGSQATIIGRGYRVEDTPVLFGLGAAAGYGAVLVVALYIASPEVQVLYTHPGRLWLLCPLFLYWISRVLILSNRDELHDDPVIFAFTDRVSWMVAACVGMVIAVAI
ncbi:MAG: UbiA family prenyltransferase [Sphingomonas sp.]